MASVFLRVSVCPFRECLCRVFSCAKYWNDFFFSTFRADKRRYTQTLVAHVHTISGRLAIRVVGAMQCLGWSLNLRNWLIRSNVLRQVFDEVISHLRVAGWRSGKYSHYTDMHWVITVSRLKGWYTFLINIGSVTTAEDIETNIKSHTLPCK